MDDESRIALTELNIRPFWIFLHMHKCAGTYVVHSAIKSGFTLPQGHQNGNLHDEVGQPVRYGDMSPDELRSFFANQRAKGTDFLAMEWDFPRLHDFPADMGLRFFTALRDPLSRAISNYRMDKIFGWCDPALSFREYMDGSALYRCDNYYTRKLCNAGLFRQIGRDDFAFACSVLNKFDEVIVLGIDDINAKLARVGITCYASSATNALAEKEERHLVPKEWLMVTDNEMIEFCERNAIDLALFARFSHSGRLSVP